MNKCDSCGQELPKEKFRPGQMVVRKDGTNKGIIPSDPCVQNALDMEFGEVRSFQTRYISLLDGHSYSCDTKELRVGSPKRDA